MVSPFTNLDIQMPYQFRRCVIELRDYLGPPVQDVRVRNIVHGAGLFIDSDDVYHRVTACSVEASGQLARFLLLRPAPLAFNQIVLDILTCTELVYSGNYSGFKIDGTHGLNAIQRQREPLSSVERGRCVSLI
ncbi:hypothetical protein SRABI83_00122 [Arthrobacter sp. Bi83]|nr:hypothetical protein SRABI83_00122 [Arthrobacter sp. Bi83]